MHGLVRSVSAVAATTTLALFAMSGASANATEASSVVIDLTYDVLQQNRTAAALATGAAREKVEHFVEQEARAGRLVNVADLDVISIDLGAQGSVGAVLPKTDTLQDLTAVLAGPNADHPVFLAGAFVDHADPAPTLPAAPGYDGAFNKSGMTRTNEACRDLWWDAAYPTVNNSDHHVYDCWEKWRDTRNNAQWAYNKYTLFDAADGKDGWKGQLVDATIRMRPWSGYEGRVTAGPYNYAPKPTDTCTTYSATISFPSGSSLGVPQVYCTPNLQVFPNGTAHSFGTDWGGRTTGQVYLDGAFRFVASSSTTTPIYADYVWLEVNYCWGPGNCYQGNPSQYLKWTDSGW